MIDIIRKTINDFCLDFIQNPYLSYTEHGQHALFYSMLYAAIPDEQKFVQWDNQKVCIVQKEYPTAMNLKKSKRQHWDVAILKSPPESSQLEYHSYDYLKLFAAIEFGMNESEDHLQDDIDRLCDEGSNIEHRFIVHLYRLSESGAKFSGRDWSSKSPRILSIESVRKIAKGFPIEIYYGISDSSQKYKSGFWKILN